MAKLAIHFVTKNGATRNLWSQFIPDRIRINTIGIIGHKYRKLTEFRDA